MSYARSKEMVREQRDDIAKILSSISDLEPINVFSNHDVDQELDAADKKRAKMVLDVQDLDQSLTNEYRQITEDLPHIQALYEELIHATLQGADVQPMHFNATAYHDSKIYQVQDEMRKQTQQYLEIKKQQEQARIMNAEASLPPDVRMYLLKEKINRGITQGLIDTGKDIVYGFIDMVRDPLKTATNTVMALWNWKQTSALIAQAITESYDKDMVHGDAYTRSRWVTYTLTTLVTSVVGTKGIGQVSKVANLEKLGTSAKKISTLAKASVVKHANKAADKINGWNNPFAPKVQIAGDVPYNSINSSGLRDKLSRIGESAGKSTFIDPINNVRSIIQQASIKKTIQNKHNYAFDDHSFSGTLKGETIILDNVDMKEITYTKRNRNEFNQLRRKFDSSVRKNFAKYLVKDQNSINRLIDAGLSDVDIEDLKDGCIPDNYQVHHKLPLDDGGTNVYSNLVLIRNDPYHKALTNAQKNLTGHLNEGDSVHIQWPIPRNHIYPEKE